MAAKHWADTYDPAGALERAELDALDIVRDVSGSSAGLVFSLAILDAASPGRLGWDEAIAATGTISPHGDVLPVTKVHAKTTAVIAAGAERIYVHPDNAAAARRATWGHASLTFRSSTSTKRQETRIALAYGGRSRSCSWIDHSV